MINLGLFLKILFKSGPRTAKRSYPAVICSRDDWTHPADADRLQERPETGPVGR